MSKADAWMPLYISEYLADTMHLNAQQHGAYMLLLMHHWRAGGVPNDDAQLSAIARCDAASWKKAVWPVLRPFFTVDGDKLIQKRAIAEREVADELVDKRSRAGKEGADKRWGRDRKAQDDGKGIAKPLANECQPQWQNDAPIPSPLPSPSLRSVEGAHDDAPPADPKPEKRQNATRLPADWEPGEPEREFAIGLGLPVDRIAAKFRDYWTAASGQNARKHDWPATWRNWCRREAESKSARIAPQVQRGNALDENARRLAELMGRPDEDFFGNTIEGTIQ